MALLDFLFGSKESETKIPQWYEDAAKSNISRAQDIAEMGYMPYYGVDVAGFTPMQQSAMQNTSNAARMYGMSAPEGGAMSGMGAMVTDPATGIQGYRSGDIFDAARQELKQRAPAQYDYYNSMVIDPVTGQYGSRTRGGEALGLLNQIGVDTSGLNANSSSGDYEQAVNNYDYGQMSSGSENLLLSLATSDPKMALLSGNPLSALLNLAGRYAAGKAIDNRMDAIENQIDTSYNDQQNGIYTVVDSSGNVKTTYSPETFPGGSNGSPAWDSSGNVYNGGGWSSADNATTDYSGYGTDYGNGYTGGWY